jgi:hypothetical protein
MKQFVIRYYDDEYCIDDLDFFLWDDELDPEEEYESEIGEIDLPKEVSDAISVLRDYSKKLEEIALLEAKEPFKGRVSKKQFVINYADEQFDDILRLVEELDITNEQYEDFLQLISELELDMTVERTKHYLRLVSELELGMTVKQYEDFLHIIGRTWGH